jgi:Phage protein Gp138 N-terminal domain
MPSNYNPIVAPQPELADLLKVYLRNFSMDLNCHALGTVQSFDSDAMTVDATINYSITSVSINTANGTYQQKQTPYPSLQNVPVVIMGGGTSALTFPISQGDQCLLLFNDRDIDNWFQQQSNGTTPGGPLNSNRLHSLTDAIAIIGLLPNLLLNYSATHAILQNGSTQVGVSSSKVLINNSSDNTLGDILSSLCGDLSTLCSDLSTVFTAIGTAMGALGQTAAATACTTVVTQLTTLGTDFSTLQTDSEGLLE